MIDYRVKSLARLLVGYSLEINRGDLFMIKGTDLAAPLIREVFREALKTGAHPVTDVAIEGIDEIFLKEAAEHQLQHVPPLSRQMVATFDAVLNILGGYNPKALSGVDPRKMAASYRARSELTEIYLRRVANRELKACVTEYPTHASAQEAGMSLTEYADFVYRACTFNRDEPVKAWRRVSAYQQELADKLNGVSNLRIIATDTDLRLRVGGRKWVNCDGHENMPDGEIFVSPHEDSVEGVVRFSFPGTYSGQEIEDIRLEFKEGKVVDADALRGRDLLLALLDTDEGSRRVGELGIGTNTGINRFTRNMLFDEKMAGTIHLALGASLRESGGTNTSAIHWDMLCDLRQGGRIIADGDVIYEGGRFLLERLN